MFKIWDTLGPYYLVEEFNSEESARSWLSSQYYAPRHSRFSIINFKDDRWRRIARENLDTHTVMVPVWQEESWYVPKIELTGTYASVNPDDPTKIDYFPNEIKGEKGISQSTTPGRFLKKFFSDVLDEKQIKEWAERHKECYVDSKSLLKFARTPEEIARVYSMPAGFSSCMQGGIHNFNYNNVLNQHPTSIYGAGDLSVAYIERGGLLVARAIVWEEKKKVGRVYGEGAILRSALKANGIPTTSNTQKYDTFEGARLLHVKTTENVGDTVDEYSIVAPYIDGGENGVYCGNLYEDGYIHILDGMYSTSSYTYKHGAQFVLVGSEGVACSRVRCFNCEHWVGGHRSRIYDSLEDINGYHFLCSACRDLKRFRERISQCEITGYNFDNTIFECEDINYCITDYWSSRPRAVKAKYAPQLVKLLGAESSIATCVISNEMYMMGSTVLLHDGRRVGSNYHGLHTQSSWFDGELYLKSELLYKHNKWGTEEQHRNYESLFSSTDVHTEKLLSSYLETRRV